MICIVFLVVFIYLDFKYLSGINDYMKLCIMGDVDFLINIMN